MADMLSRIVFVLMAAAAGFVPGGLLVILLIEDRPRTGFEGVAETVLGALGGVVLGLIASLLLVGRIDRTRRMWSILMLLALLVVEAAVLLARQS